MLSKLKSTLAIAIVVFGLSSLALVPVQPVSALNPTSAAENGVDGAGGGGNQISLREAIRTVINILLFLIGAVAVVMIIIGGIKYTLSNGDSGQVTSAKNTVLYAVIGLVVAILAYAIVNFVINGFKQ